MSKCSTVECKCKWCGALFAVDSRHSHAKNCGSTQCRKDANNEYATELKKTLSKAFRDCIAELKKKYPGILLTKEEAAELMKELSITLKTELDKLTQKGKK